MVSWQWNFGDLLYNLRKYEVGPAYCLRSGLTISEASTYHSLTLPMFRMVDMMPWDNYFAYIRFLVVRHVKIILRIYI